MVKKPPLRWRLFLLLDDPTTTCNLVFLIEDGRLARGNGPLGLIEDGLDAVIPGYAQRRWRRLMAMADLDGNANGLTGFRDGNPIQAIRNQSSRQKLVIGPNLNCVRVRMNREHIQRIRRTNA